MFRAGIRLMDRSGDAGRSIWRATRYRDGLMLALQAARAFRTKNLTGMTAGGTLVRVGDGYMIVFPAEVMKARRSSFEVPVPARLTPYVDRYLTEIRPMLLQGKTSDALWITQYGEPMVPKAIYDRLVKVTLRLFGRAMSPHMFRHALATSIAIEDPTHVRMAMPMLHHSTFSTTDPTYIQAQSIQASRGWNDFLDHLRNKE
jgi:site-specific recombinase XerD